MEVDEIQRQVCKFQRISSNGGMTGDKSSNPQKIATHKANLEYQDGGGGGGGGRFCGWPSSRIVRVSRASGGKDRHSKVLTSKGLRDRRVRLSVTTAIQFYDLQDRLGYDQPSKAVEWLLKAASASISELPSLDAAFSGAGKPTQNDAEVEDRNCSNTHNQNNNNVSMSNSSTSETSKGSGLSLSRSENRIKARERAREMAAKKEKEKETDSTRAAVVNQLNGISSFTDLLTGGINSAAVSPNTAVSPESRTQWTTPMDYFFGRAQTTHMPQFNIAAAGDNQNHPHHQFSFLQEGFSPAAAGGGSGFNRGTLQSNLSSFLPPHNHNLPRFQSLYGSTSTNFPFFMAPNSVSVAPEQFPETGYDGQRLPPCYGGGDGGGRQSDHHNHKTKH